MAETSNAQITDANLSGSGTAQQAKERFGFQHYQSVSWNLAQMRRDDIYRKGDPCAADSELSEISTNIQKMFVILRGVQNYGDFYINGAINKVEDLRGKLSSITSAIAGVLKSLVQRVRNWVLNKVKKLIAEALNFLEVSLLKMIKQGVVAAIMDQIFCAFEDIITGLFDLVGDFLYALIGQIIQTPFCVAEEWTNAILNKLVNDIDTALEPVFDSINEILSGVATIYGSVSEAIDFILGFQGFICGSPECPEVKQFALGPAGGPTAAQKDSFNNFGISDSFAGEISDTANGWLNDFFGKDTNNTESPGECYTGTFECGIPQVIIFGGGGSGAVAEAVVNQVGQVIGTNLLSSGSDYTSAPFVQIVDPAGCGSGASAYAVMGTDDNGFPDGTIEFINIGSKSGTQVSTSSAAGPPASSGGGTGGGYSGTFNGGTPVIQQFYGKPNPITVDNSVNLTWDVANADTVSLGIAGYTDLPSNGTVSIPINSSDVSFAAGSSQTTKTFTLKATKSNTSSTPSSKESSIIITVSKKLTESSTVNTSTPEIKSFTVNNQSSYTATPGSIITFYWQTINAQKVEITDYDGTLPASSGSLSIVLPDADDLEFPSDGSGITNTYKLTATNDNATTTTDTESVTVKIVESPAASDGASTSTSTGTDEDEDEDEDSSTSTGNQTSGTGNNDAVSSISNVSTISTGIGYTDDDEVTVDDGEGGEFSITTNTLGQIVSFNVLNPGYGYTTVPNITIISKKGVGAKFKVNLKFTPLNQFLEQEQLETIDPNKLVQVVDCIGTTRATIPQINN